MVLSQQKYIWFLLWRKCCAFMWWTEKKFLFFLNKFNDFVPINSYFMYILCPNFLFYSYFLALQIPIFLFFWRLLALDTLFLLGLWFNRCSMSLNVRLYPLILILRARRHSLCAWIMYFTSQLKWVEATGDFVEESFRTLHWGHKMKPVAITSLCTSLTYVFDLWTFFDNLHLRVWRFLCIVLTAF